MKAVKTNAMRILDQHKINYVSHEYPHKDKEAVDGITVATMLNQNPEKVFKTLITQGKSKQYYVFVIPVSMELDLKRAASVVQEKSIEMIPVKQINAISGYIRGGCSPIGMKKIFPTQVYHTALEHETIIFSGGQIGLQIEMDPKELIKVIPVRFDL